MNLEDELYSINKEFKSVIDIEDIPKNDENSVFLYFHLNIFMLKFGIWIQYKNSIQVSRYLSKFEEILNKHKNIKWDCSGCIFSGRTKETEFRKDCIKNNIPAPIPCAINSIII